MLRQAVLHSELSDWFWILFCREVVLNTPLYLWVPNVIILNITEFKTPLPERITSYLSTLKIIKEWKYQVQRSLFQIILPHVPGMWKYFLNVSPTLIMIVVCKKTHIVVCPQKAVQHDFPHIELLLSFSSPFTFYFLEAQSVFFL